MLTSPPVLRYYDVTKPISIEVDASQFAIGGVLLQEGHPVEYMSRALTTVERDGCAQIEHELLAIILMRMRMLGQATYIGAKYCPNYSEMTAKIHELLKHDTEFM